LTELIRSVGWPQVSWLEDVDLDAVGVLEGRSGLVNDFDTRAIAEWMAVSHDGNFVIGFVSLDLED
jgi:hypothetical protein